MPEHKDHEHTQSVPPTPIHPSWSTDEGEAVEHLHTAHKEEAPHGDLTHEQHIKKLASHILQHAQPDEREHAKRLVSMTNPGREAVIEHHQRVNRSE